jgi:hypothetical protein
VSCEVHIDKNPETGLHEAKLVLGDGAGDAGVVGVGHEAIGAILQLALQLGDKLFPGEVARAEPAAARASKRPPKHDPPEVEVEYTPEHHKGSK